MAAHPRLPNELMLLIFGYQTTVTDLLALSSTSHAMRSLFLDNTSGIISEACKNTNLLSAAKALVDTIFEIAALPTHLCDCAAAKVDPYYHFDKNASHQRYMADLLIPSSADLRSLRMLSRVHKLAMLFAHKAVDFWTARAHNCQVDHKLTIDMDKVAQIYLLLWVCAESHFSTKLDARAINMVAELPKPALSVFWESQHPDGEDWAGTILGNRVKLDDRGDRLDPSEELSMNLWEWIIRTTHLEHALNARQEAWVQEKYDAWLSEKPEECTCHQAILIDWDLVQIEWWRNWTPTI
ncbi:uncharacterized protein M437DRAFT_62323 [Aureobasidium melanogenum CBS 110374]|uniref:F-box domain-containing protein n=1 Tax=Aureobasidium melanogenum (strain CBS 110374) TaxID=1043003 RepID=A0A074W504_AURM1|nr:uncharacterized protein M437DRAFT_62323 [Aureobasidium melanogenum CBS 110374]KEQ67963.1 hypothetical protein M437DRAFT_62323 [Aureobasidium melanogenum CBS 110374]